MSRIDVSPRRVWLGLTIPGKKMMAMLSPDAGVQRGQSLIDLYKDAPYEALLAVAIALHTLPEQGAQHGPAFRNLRKPLEPLMLYGAILTDIRDFLKFRFRCSGLTAAEAAPFTSMQEGLRTGDLRGVLEELQTHESGVAATGYVVSYVVTTLDDLSQDTTMSREDFNSSIRKLRDVLRAIVRWAYPESYGGQEHYDQYIDTLFVERDE